MRDISVIICTHNPRADYFWRVLDALKGQVLPKEQWELLVVDNASNGRIDEVWDLSWHPHARHIREDELGLTSARLRGIKESTGSVLVFVDDDNVVGPEYLCQCQTIAESWPMLGAWGGKLLPEFESPPEEWTKHYLPLIGAGPSAQDDRWSNQYDDGTTPCGAGLCIRRSVAERYAGTVYESPERRRLDRTGALLLCGGDTDMALTACDMGMGTGFFSSLRLVHLISSRRLTREYLLTLRQSMTYSQVILSSFRPHLFRPKNRLRLVVDYLRAFVASAPERSFRLASLRGEIKARRTLRGQNGRTV